MSVQGDDLAKYFSVPKNAFRVVGIDITARVNTISEPWRLILVVSTGLFLTMCTAAFCYKNYANAEVLIDTLGMLVSELLTLIKISLFLYKRKSMVSLVRTMRKLSLQVSEAEMALLKRVNSKFAVVSKQYHRLYGVIGLFFLLVPLGTTLTIYIKSSEVQFIPPYMGSYPIDVSKPLNYFIIYVCGLTFYHFAYHSIVGINCLFLWCAVNLGAQFRLLQLKLDSLETVNNLDRLTDKARDQERVAVSLKRYICFHQKLLAVALTFRKSFESILMVLNTLNSIQICLTVYRIGQCTSAAMLATLLLLLLENLGQLMIYCYGGQHLEGESENVGWYFSSNIDWAQWHISTTKLSLLPLQVAQKPCRITGVFLTANYSLFLWVLQSSYSYITLLRSFEN